MSGICKKAAQHPKFKNWFKQQNPGQPLMRAKYAETLSRHKRLQKSLIPYFTKLLNKENGHYKIAKIRKLR